MICSQYQLQEQTEQGQWLSQVEVEAPAVNEDADAVLVSLSRLPVAHSLSRLTVALFPVLSPGRSCPCHVSRSLMSLSRLPVPLFPVLMLLLVCFPKSCCDPATGEPGALVQKVQSPDDYLTIKRTSIETSSMQTDCT